MTFFYHEEGALQGNRACNFVVFFGLFFFFFLFLFFFRFETVVPRKTSLTRTILGAQKRNQVNTSSAFASRLVAAASSEVTSLRASRHASFFSLALYLFLLLSFLSLATFGHEAERSMTRVSSIVRYARKYNASCYLCRPCVLPLIAALVHYFYQYCQ